jgi:hypothetical protein
MKSLVVLVAVLLVGTIAARSEEPISGAITRPRSQAVGGTLLIDLIGIIMVGATSLIALIVQIALILLLIPITLFIMSVVIGLPLLIVGGPALILTLLIAAPFILIGGLLLVGTIALFLAAVGTLVISCIGLPIVGLLIILPIIGLLILAGLFIIGLPIIGLPIVIYLTGTIFINGAVNLIGKICCLPCNLLCQPFKDLVKKAAN